MNKNETIKKGTINMKKLTALFLGLAMVLSLAACGTSISDETSAPETSTPSASSEAQEPSVAPESTESTGNTEEPSSQPETEGATGKTLVVYYSATGNTEQVANYIANITGGDLFELEPVEPYTSDGLDWTNDNSRVSQEYYDESLRDVELVADTVEIGTAMTPYSSVIRSGGALLPGRRMAL